MSISLITTSYERDFEACRLLCDSIDAFVTGYERHYIVVEARDLARFSVLAGPRRQIVDAASVLDLPLAELPIRWKGRRYFWGAGLSAPIYGWHLQQLRKIAMTLAQREERALHLDSDICFVRPFDVQRYAGNRVPLKCAPGAIDERLPQHVKWWDNAHKVLGLPVARLPGDDYVGPMIVWERDAVAAMAARIGGNWAARIAATRDFSEYILYGLMVASDPALAARHVLVPDVPCLTYWDGPPLDAAGLAAFTAGLGPEQSAIVIQSFTETPSRIIRDFALGGRAAA